MNSTLSLMQSHRSIRKFTQAAITTEQFQQIIDSARSAATSSLLQCVSIIRVTDQTKRQKLVELTGNQPYVGTAAEFLVFCIDFNRHKTLIPDAQLGFTEQTLIGAVDAALMGQNALLAAQSMGLGGVFIGGIRNHPLDVCQLLELPEQVLAVFGLCLGVPDQDPQLKPRMPVDITVHENAYKPVDVNAIVEYDSTMNAYYQARLNDPMTKRNWRYDMAEKLTKESRPFMQGCLQTQGLSVR